MLSFLTSLAFSPIVLSPENITIHEFFISLQRDSQMYKHVYVHIPSCFVHFLDFLNHSFMRYNLRTIKFTPLHCTVQWICISQGIVQPSSWSGGLPSVVEVAQSRTRLKWLSSSSSRMSSCFFVSLVFFSDIWNYQTRVQTHSKNPRWS